MTDNKKQISGEKLNNSNKPKHLATNNTCTKNIKQDRIKKLCLIILIIVAAGTFSGLFIKFTVDRSYVEQQFTAIRAANDEAFANLNERLSAIEKQMNSISIVLNETGNTIDTSGQQTRQAMQNQITALNRELSQLKESLEILKESKGNL